MYDFKNVFFFHATLTLEGIIQDAGGKALWDSEFERENLLGEDFSKIIFWQHNENISQLIANSIKTAAEGKPLEIETTFRNDASKISTIKGKFTPVLDSNNVVEKIIFSSTDVTEYIKEIEFHKKTSERYLYSAESAEVGLWFWNLTTNELFTTPTCNEIYGLPPNEIMTFEKFLQSVHPDDLAKVQASLAESHTNLIDYNIEYRIFPKQDKISWVSVRGKTFREDENALLMMGSVRNITHRKIYEQRIEQILEAEKIARDTLEEVNREKDHFLAVLSHELRSPLNSILGWSKILLSKKVDEATQKNALETIESGAKLQAKLISDLIDSSKIISGKLHFTFISLSFKSLINRVYQSEKPLADEKGVNLVLGSLVDVRVMGDASRLQQAIINLVTNAIKFTPPGGEINISSKIFGDNVVFNICDSGSGIPPEELPYIFKQYFQSKSAQNKTGLGLGLSIVKAIVTKHRGQVAVRNNENRNGCTFSVSLPIQQNMETDTATKPNININSASPLKNLDILVVEDNDDSREVLQFYLVQMGAKVYSVSSAREGLNYLTSTDSLPSVIISDISMPEEDGLIFMSKVRKLPDDGGGLIPAIALTAFASSNDTERIMESGFQKHHIKPFEADLLIKDILEVVNP